MSTIIERRPVRSTLRFVASACAALGCWLVCAALFTLLVEPDQTVTVFGPESSILRAVAATNVRWMAGGPGFAVVSGDSRGFVRALYQGGAWFVLPGAIGACYASKGAELV